MSNPRGFWSRLGRAVAFVFLTALALLLMVPMVWMVLCAFTPQSELQRAVPMGGTFSALSVGTLTSPSQLGSWMRTYFTLENFHEPQRRTGLFDVTAMPRDEFERAPVHGWLFAGVRAIRPADPQRAREPVPGGRLLLWFENTLFIAVATTVLSVLLNAMAGYAFAKIDFPGRKTMFWLVIGTIMIPGQVTVIPLFLLFTGVLKWHNSFLAVILPMVAAPVGIFLMKQYIQSLPGTLEDAARIDGCTEIGIFGRVILPLSKPILAVWAIFTFIGAWKAFLWPLIITDSQDMYMLEVGLKTLQFTAGARNIGVVMSAALLASIPMVAVFFLFQKHLTKGLTVGAVKG
ncbi:MAG: carbohydrate ABC transporter permease [Candidatus Sumerlaeaceae bacterium]|nr:carbohydrate ABC transporter permease [Candidatus Sumerlaeaceae bacterium]